MASLVIAEHDNASLKEATAKVVTAAAQVSTPVHVLVAGQGAGAVAAAAAKLAGVEKVLLADDALYAKMVAETMETLILSLADKYDAILAPATTNGKNYMPRVAAKLDVAQVSEIIAVDSPDTFQRPIYAGNAIATVQAAGGKKVITVRTTTFKAAGEGGSAPSSSARNYRNPNAPNSPRPRSSSQAGAACSRATISTFWTRSPTNSTPRSAPAAPPSMPVSSPTTIRSARPAKWWRRNFISPSAFPVRSSIWPA
jgi:electron transfer flavoprotein alpha subunit